MHIEFQHDPRGESIARIHRADGIVLVLPSASGQGRIPHDLAHAVAERELKLSGGVFGRIAAGAVFENMRVAEGKPRLDAASRSKQILALNRRSLTLAEVMAGTIHDAVEHNRPTPLAEAREGWGILEQDPFPWTIAEIAHATDTLRSLGKRWQATPEPLPFTWPKALTYTPREEP